MKKLFGNKILSVALIVALIFGSTAALGIAMAAAQNAADSEVVVNPIPIGDGERAVPTSTPAPNVAAPPDPNDLIPRPQDIPIEAAREIVKNELLRIFGVSESDYGEIEPTYVLGFWFIWVYKGEVDIGTAVGACTLDSVTGHVELLHYWGNIEVKGELPPGQRPSPGDDTYNEAAIEAMHRIKSDATILNTRFFRDGHNHQTTFWIAVSLDDGNDYLIGLTKGGKKLVGYSFNEGRIDEALFAQ